MTIAIASLVSAVAGVGARNIVAWLKDSESFNIRHSVASGIVAFLVAIPAQVAAFSAMFADVETIPIEAQLAVFVVQVTSVAGFDALTKGGVAAAVKGAMASLARAKTKTTQ